MRAAAPQALQRVHLSFSFLTKAVELREHGFFEYWTALEVLCAGKAPKIRSQIQKGYGWQRSHDVDKILGFEKVSQMRHALVHKGILPSMSPGFERYMHLLFLDLLSCGLGLPMRGLLLSYVRETNFDISFSGGRGEDVESQTREPLTAEAAAAEKENVRRSWIDLLDRLGH
jgi:hypothetical protein